MKKLFLVGAISCLFLGNVSAHSINPSYTDSTTTIGNSSNQAKALQLRLNQINEMDLSELDHQQKKAIKKEVQKIEKELKAADNGIYISVGGAIIIILLLILIF